MKSSFSLVVACAVALVFLATTPTGADGRQLKILVFDTLFESPVKTQRASLIDFDGQRAKMTEVTQSGGDESGDPTAPSDSMAHSVLSYMRSTKSDLKCHRSAMDLNSIYYSGSLL